MKHVLDKSNPSQTVSALRQAYVQDKAKRPNASTLALQQRPSQEKTGASKTRQFLRIDRGQRA